MSNMQFEEQIIRALYFIARAIRDQNQNSDSVIAADKAMSQLAYPLQYYNDANKDIRTGTALDRI